MMRAVMLGLIETRETDNLRRVLRLMPTLDAVDYSICIAIVAATDDDSILNEIEGLMRRESGGSGTYGENIAGRELRKNEARIQEERRGASDAKVIAFCDRVLTHLKDDIKRADVEHEERMRAEREDFDSQRENE
jgi:hypothetical protein